MRVFVAESPDAVARRAAGWLQGQVAHAVAARKRCLVALSGGKTPARMLHELRRLRVHWHELHVFQVDERVVPLADERRNARQVNDLLIGPGGLDASRFHAMPVERPDLDSGALDYESVLEEFGGRPPVLDVVHLGLGADGHTASLVPGDPLLDEHGRRVGASIEYNGVPRLTLTYPALDAARHRLWVVTGADKAAALQRLYEGDATIPAGRVSREAAFVFADEDAAKLLPAQAR